MYEGAEERERTCALGEASLNVVSDDVEMMWLLLMTDGQFRAETNAAATNSKQARLAVFMLDSEGKLAGTAGSSGVSLGELLLECSSCGLLELSPSEML